MTAKPTSGPRTEFPERSSFSRAMTEHAPLAMAIVEVAGHMVRLVNPAFCRLMDKTAGQLVGMPFCEMSPETDDSVTFLNRVCRTIKPESHTEQQHSKPSPFFSSYTLWPVIADEHPVRVMIQ